MGSKPIFMVLTGGKLYNAIDMSITHEEYDTVIIRQTIQANLDQILVIADDTNIFKLLSHFVFYVIIRVQVQMISPISGDP